MECLKYTHSNLNSQTCVLYGLELRNLASYLNCYYFGSQSDVGVVLRCRKLIKMECPSVLNFA